MRSVFTSIAAAALLVACADAPAAPETTSAGLMPCKPFQLSCMASIIPGYVVDTVTEYSLPNDPHPYAEGMWLGSDVTPERCFGHLGYVDDVDTDLLDDYCEWRFAAGFAPVMVLHPDDSCPWGEPAWAAKYWPQQGNTVRIAYLPSYHADCGMMGHYGDSEMISVDIQYNASTQHWEFVRMWTSAHYGAPSFLGRYDRSAWNSQPAYAIRIKGPPTVWVADDKHGNYVSAGTCNDTPNMDRCQDGPYYWTHRFRVFYERNAGSRSFNPFFGGLASGTYQLQYNGRREWYYANLACQESRPFNGWQPGSVDQGVTPYEALLKSDKFELLNGDAGPGASVTLPNEADATLSGPRSIGTNQTATFVVDWPGQCSTSCNWAINGIGMQQGSCTFQHAFSSGGSYTVDVWTQAFGVRAERSMLVSVSGEGGGPNPYSRVP